LTYAFAFLAATCAAGGLARLVRSRLSPAETPLFDFDARLVLDFDDFPGHRVDEQALHLDARRCACGRIGGVRKRS